MQEESKLSDVAPDETFKAHTGEEIKNLKQLLGVLESVSPESFTHHVNGDKNDFANWVNDSVKDDELATAMQATTDFDETKRIVRDRIEHLEKSFEIKKIKDNIDSLDSVDMGLDKVPDDLIKPESPPEKAGIPPSDVPEASPMELKQSDMHKTTPITSEEQNTVSPGLHPFEQVKRSLHSRILDALLGLIVGIILGIIIGSFF